MLRQHEVTMSQPEFDADLVSVVMPTCNRAGLLPAAIASVRQQTWPRTEIVVVDDASTDETPAVLRELAASIPVLRVIRNDEARGAASARNQGISAATGPWIAFLDDDDRWMPRKLELQIAALRSNPEAVAASCDFVVKYRHGISRRIRTLASPDEQQLLRVNSLGGASMCVTTKAHLERIGGFTAGLRSGQDWDLWIRLRGLGTFVSCAEPLVQYYPHRGPRISRSYRSAYLGRRRLFFSYRSKMSAMTRRRNLAELIFLRVLVSRWRPSVRWRDVTVLAAHSSLLGLASYVVRWVRADSGRTSPVSTGNPREGRKTDYVG